MTDAAASTVRAVLADRSVLFSDPDAYLAGVDDALRARRTPSESLGSRAHDPLPVRPLLDGRSEE